MQKRTSGPIVLVASSLILALGAAPVGAQSLWSPDAPELLADRARLRPGDIVTVEVDASATLSFRSLQNDARSLSLELSGGQGGSLFSFLPSGSSSGDRSVQGGEELSLRASVGARVQEVSPEGMVFILGVRRVSAGGREESVTVSGWLDPKNLSADRRVRFDRLADSRVVFRTLLQPASPALAAGDLVEGRPPEPARGPAAASAAGAAGPAPAPAVPAAAAVPAPAAQIQVSEARKRELLLQYLNRIVDILFQ